MKKKSLSFWLLPLVVLIWGGVAFRWWDSSAQARPEALSLTTVPRQQLHWSRAEREPLKLNYRDPFLNRPFVAARKIPKTSPRAGLQPEAKPPRLRFRYRGGVKSASREGLVGLLEHDGELMQLQEGELCGGWRVQRLSMEEALLRKGNMQLVLSSEP